MSLSSPEMEDAMNFAENNRISHRQLRRQIFLTFAAPLLLCVVGWQNILGPEGAAGTLLGAAAVTVYLIFLTRLGPVYQNPKRHMGRFLRFVTAAFFLSYVVCTGAYLLSLLEAVVPKYLLTGGNGRFLGFFSILACGMGMGKGMQKRGRMAEVAGGAVLWGVLLLYLLSISQGETGRLYLAAPGSIPLNVRGVLSSFYGFFAAFSGLGLLPFLLDRVEKSAGAARPMAAAVWTLAGILAAGLILLQAAFGEARVQAEPYPILPLMAGANLPGNVLGRFDVIWMGILLYGLLFSIGTTLYYGTHLLRSHKMEAGRWWLAGLMLFLSWDPFPGLYLARHYPSWLLWAFCPGFLLLTAWMWICRGRRRERP